MKQIVVFGATGYTGRLVVAALAGRGLRPVLAGRSQQRLRELSERYGGLDTAIADVTQPHSVRALVEHGDVLVSTVGPFLRYGEPALEAAVAAGGALCRLHRRGRVRPPGVRRVRSAGAGRGLCVADCVRL